MEDFISALGATAEATALFYLQLVKHGIPPEQAASLTAMIISNFIGGNNTDRELIICKTGRSIPLLVSSLERICLDTKTSRI